jgi:hypothetical protein
MLEFFDLSSFSFGGNILSPKRICTCDITTSFVYVLLDLVHIS